MIIMIITIFKNDENEKGWKSVIFHRILLRKAIKKTSYFYVGSFP